MSNYNSEDEYKQFLQKQQLVYKEHKQIQK